MICGEETANDQAYVSHMAIVHSGKTQLQSIQQEKEKEQNIPKVVLQKDAPIDPEFEELANMIDNPKPEPKPETPTTAKPNVIPVAGEIKPLKLRYVWEGNCPTCNTPVRTIVTKVDGRWFCTAFCLSDGELEQREVSPLEIKYEKVELVIKDIKEKEVKNGRQPNVSKKTTPQAKV